MKTLSLFAIVALASFSLVACNNTETTEEATDSTAVTDSALMTPPPAPAPAETTMDSTAAPTDTAAGDTAATPQ